MLDFVFENTSINHRSFNSTDSAAADSSKADATMSFAGYPGDRNRKSSALDISHLIAERLKLMLRIS